MIRQAVLFIVVCLVAASGSSAHGAYTIHLTDEGFVPATLDVPVGATVVFENTGTDLRWPASNNHPTHEEYAGFDPLLPIAPGKSWSFAFAKEGIWGFHDHLYPAFTGSIIVAKETRKRWWSLKGFLTGLVSLFFDGPSPPVPAPLQTQPHLSASSEEVYVAYNHNCSSIDGVCIFSAFKNLTAVYGPQHALTLLARLQGEGKIRRSIDDHQLAHQIGRATAAVFGVSPALFLSCTTLFNYGCQHGYFEQVLGKTGSGKEAIALICDPINDSYSSKFKFYCYHGAGHGVLMSTAYDLSAALAVCNSLDTRTAQEGCWQGVFMENVNGALKGQARAGVFSDTDVLAPCNALPEKYQHECFINHAGWLIARHNHSMHAASRACLKAPESMVMVCMQSLGLMVSNPTWHTTLEPAGNTFVEKTSTLCAQFPDEHREQCIIGAVDNILNFDELNVARANAFCSAANASYRERCAYQIGVALRAQSVDVYGTHGPCASLDVPLQNACTSGAGLVRT